MAIRESLLNTISSVSNSDFVRTVTAAGASSKATVANLAKAIIENYAGTSLGGSDRSVKIAIDSIASTVSTHTSQIDSLNSKLVVKTIAASSPATFSLGVGTRAIAFSSSAYSENAGIANIAVSNSGFVYAIKIAGMTSITFDTSTNNALTVSGTQYSAVGILVLTGSAI